MLWKWTPRFDNEAWDRQSVTPPERKMEHKKVVSNRKIKKSQTITSINATDGRENYSNTNESTVLLRIQFQTSKGAGLWQVIVIKILWILCCFWWFIVISIGSGFSRNCSHITTASCSWCFGTTINYQRTLSPQYTLCKENYHIKIIWIREELIKKERSNWTWADGVCLPMLVLLVLKIQICFWVGSFWNHGRADQKGKIKLNMSRWGMFTNACPRIPVKFWSLVLKIQIRFWVWSFWRLCHIVWTQIWV